MRSPPEDLLFGDQHERFAGRYQAARQRAHHDERFARATESIQDSRIETAELCSTRMTTVADQRSEALRLRFGARRDHHRKPSFTVKCESLEQRIESSVLASCCARAGAAA